MIEWIHNGYGVRHWQLVINGEHQEVMVQKAEGEHYLMTCNGTATGGESPYWFEIYNGYTEGAAFGIATLIAEHWLMTRSLGRPTSRHIANDYVGDRVCLHIFEPRYAELRMQIRVILWCCGWNADHPIEVLENTEKDGWWSMAEFKGTYKMVGMRSLRNSNVPTR